MRQIWLCYKSLQYQKILCHKSQKHKEMLILLARIVSVMSTQIQHTNVDQRQSYQANVMPQLNINVTFSINYNKQILFVTVHLHMKTLTNRQTTKFSQYRLICLYTFVGKATQLSKKRYSSIIRKKNIRCKNNRRQTNRNYPPMASNKNLHVRFLAAA